MKSGALLKRMIKIFKSSIGFDSEIIKILFSHNGMKHIAVAVEFGNRSKCSRNKIKNLLLCFFHFLYAVLLLGYILDNKGKAVALRCSCTGNALPCHSSIRIDTTEFTQPFYFLIFICLNRLVLFIIILPVM